MSKTPLTHPTASLQPCSHSLTTRICTNLSQGPNPSYGELSQNRRTSTNLNFFHCYLSGKQYPAIGTLLPSVSPCTSNVVPAHKSLDCFGTILLCPSRTYQPFRPENLLQLDFLHQHFNTHAHMAGLKQTHFICFKLGSWLVVLFNRKCFAIMT